MDSPRVFPAGRGLREWVGSGGRPARCGTLRYLSFLWQSHWFDLNLRLQTASLGQKGGDIADPVFVLGLWRSGTTFLHELLSLSPRLFTPNTMQCMNAATFLLQGSRPRSSRAVKRPMDDMEVRDDSPQEDEFALLALGVPSAYRGFLDPRRLDELAEVLAPSYWHADRPGSWAATWLQFLSAVAASDSKYEGRTLLLKSPNHTFRINAIDELFSGAKYVWLVRDPEELLASNRKMWISMFGEYSLWDWDAGLLDAFLAKAMRHAASALELAATRFPPDRLRVVSFDGLIEDPVGIVLRLDSQLATGLFDADSWELRRRVDTDTHRHAPKKPPESVGPELAASMEILRQAQSNALMTHAV